MKMTDEETDPKVTTYSNCLNCNPRGIFPESKDAIYSYANIKIL